MGLYKIELLLILITKLPVMTKCEYTFIKGYKKGEKCLYENCVMHDEYGGNLARYLNLPKEFVNIAKKIKIYDYFKFVGYLEDSYLIDNKEKLISICSNIVDIYSLYDNKARELLIIFLYIFLDTPLVRKHLLSDVRFKNVVNIKLQTFDENPIASYRFKKYLMDNFVISKRFLSIKKNKEYRTKYFRIYMKVVVTANKWFNNMIEKRYSPGGLGAVEARENFRQNVKYLYVKY
jgi:hypothetical protein